MIPVNILNDFVKTKGVCYVDVLSTAMRLLDLESPMVDFTLTNIRQISKKIERNIIIHQENSQQPLYDVKSKFEKQINISVKNFPDVDESIFDFRLDLKPPKIISRCQKTPGCSYTSPHLPNLRRHELICTDQQITVEQQVEYGIDKTTIKKLYDLGFLPEEALEFRKTFFTTFDCESLESFEGVEDMKNVIAIHKIVSVAVSTNRGHSRCFVRENSRHESAVQIFEDFLDFLEEINLEYEMELPDYFQTAIDHLELMTCEQSILSKHEKMKLAGLKSNLEKYLLQDIFGFNSGYFVLSFII